MLNISVNFTINKKKQLLNDIYINPGLCYAHGMLFAECFARTLEEIRIQNKYYN
jgi:hypothetical protein